MSVLVPSLTNNHHHHHSSSYYSTNTNYRINGNLSQTKSSRLTQNKINDNNNDQTNDHVPHGVVNSMKQRLLDKVNESFLLNKRHSLSKSSSRISSNENLLQTKTSLSPLKHTTRLSRSQDNLTNNTATNNNYSLSAHLLTTEQITSYIQPKQDVIIVDAITTITNEDNDNEGKLRPGQKTSIHRQSYTELRVDEAPKPGTVTTVKNMFERQIRLSRYDADKVITSSTPGSSRMSSQHREISTPTRSRSISPNDMALRQRRTNLSGSILPLTSTTLSLPVPTSYPDLVISHTPPTETTKTSNEQIHNENLTINNNNNNNNQGINKDKKIFISNRNTIAQEHIPLSVIVDETLSNVTNNHRPNLLLPSTSSSVSETVDNQTLDFKSRLALFNRTNSIQKSNENTLNIKKSLNQTNLLTKPVIHHPTTRLINDEKKDIQPEIIHNQLSIPISRSVVNTAKAVTFFGGNKLNGNTTSSLPSSIPPPPPISSSSSQTNMKNDQSSISASIDLLRAPDIIGGNVKLNKSSIFSGTKKDTRVQFIDSVDTFEYPSFEVAMAELGSTGSDDDNDIDDDDDDPSSVSSNGDDNNTIKTNTNRKINDKQEESNDPTDDVDDDELERLARINAQFNTNNLGEKPLKPKGTLHTFRPTHLDQYELGTQHGCITNSKSSDTPTYSIVNRQKLVSSSDISTKPLSNSSNLKSSKSNMDMTNNIQWSSMSTTTDLLF